MKRKMLMTVLIAATTTCVLAGCGNAAVESNNNSVLPVASEDNQTDDSVVSDGEKDAAEPEETTAPGAKEGENAGTTADGEQAQDKTAAPNEEADNNDVNNENKSGLPAASADDAAVGTDSKENGNNSSSSTGTASNSSKNASTKKDAKAEEEAKAEAKTEGTSYTSAEFVNYLNKKRAEKGLSQVSYASNLEELAMQRAKEIATDYSHDGIIGKSGVAYENIASEFTSDYTEWYTVWANSPSHAETMFDPDITTCVVGVYELNGQYFLAMIGDAKLPSVIEAVKENPDNAQAIVEEAAANGEMVCVGTETFEDGSSITVYANPEADCHTVTNDELIEASGLSREEWWQNAYNGLIEMGLTPDEAKEIADMTVN